MAYGDNPGQRLLLLLTQAKTHMNQPTRNAWAAVFGIDANDLGEILSQGAMTYRLALETRAAVETYVHDDPDLILQHFAGVEQTVGNFQSMTAHPNMAQFLAPYTSLAEYSLRHAASLLHRRQAEAVLSDASLTKLSEQTRELIQSVTDSPDLEDDLKLWMTDLLSEVSAALARVAVSGTAGLNRATDRLVGGIVRSPSRLSRFASYPMWKSVIALITALNLALGTAVEWQQLTQDQKQQIIQVIEPSQGPSQPPAIESGS